MAKRPLQRRWIYLAFLAFRTGIRWLPLSAARALGAGVGWCAYALLGRYRRLTWSQLRLAFGPSLSEETCSYLARRVFVNLGKTAAEWCVMARYSPARIRRLVEVHGLKYLRQALAKGKGVLAVSGHFGNWELLSIAVANLGFQGGVLARRLRYPEYEDFLWRLRTRLGVATYERGCVKDVARALKANHIIGVVPDQDVDSLEGVFVEFFERPAYTPVGPAALSLMTGAPIVPCFCVRSGRRFRIMIEEPLAVPATSDRAAAMQQLTQAWSGVVESYVRRYPEQWAWMHRRWKTQVVHSPKSIVHGTPQTTDKKERTGSLIRTPQPVFSPIVLAMVYGLSSMVYSGCTKPAAPVSPPPSATKTAQAPASVEETSQMQTFTMVGYAPDGAKRWELVGTGATVEGAWVTIRQPNAVGFSPDRTAYMTASLAHIEQTSRRIRLEHDVTMHTSEGLWLMSPVMYWLPDREELLTEDAVRLETDHMLVRGRGATGHSQLKRAQIQRDVDVVLNPTAQEPAEGPSHVHITCDGPLSFDYERHVATFEHNVHVVDRQGDIYSDKLVAYLDRVTRAIRYAEALGHVRIVQGTNTATSERAVYEPAFGKVTLVGSPSLVLYPDDKQQAPGVATSLETLMTPRMQPKQAGVSTPGDPAQLFQDVAKGQ
ncbi:MAG: LPS export ABC transporter periplasmic protein LptC [Candidatus Omnitrophica bacterium]|nr:LPS export ABC transporter periplasmic protein LptC [Candidatus Omnitrophota bacterium]